MLVIKLDNILLGNIKLFVNLPIFDSQQGYTGHKELNRRGSELPDRIHGRASYAFYGRGKAT